MNSELALKVLRNLLKPAVRLGLRYGIQLNELVEALKGVMVEVAREITAREGEPCSASRISVVTGVHRKDIARLLRTEAEHRPPASLISRIMAQWQHSPRFVTKAGKPRVLSCEGRHSEFSNLVESVNGGDLSGYAVLYEMERRGIVERKGGAVKLAWVDYAPSDSLKEQLEQWGEDAVDLGLAIEENLFEQRQDKNHHLKTVFDNIPKSQLAHIRTWLMHEGSAFHQKVRRFLAGFDRDVSPSADASGERMRVAFGSFSLCSLAKEKAVKG